MDSSSKTSNAVTYGENYSHLDIKEVSTLVKELLSRDVERLWIIGFQVYNIYEQSTIEYVTNCIPAIKMYHNLTWLNHCDARPQFIDDLVEYFVVESNGNGKRKHEWDLISIGSILIHLVLDSTSSVKLNGSYSLHVFNKTIELIDLITMKLANTYFMYSKIPEKCKVRTLALFSNLLEFCSSISIVPVVYHQSILSKEDKENSCSGLAEDLLRKGLNELNALLGTYSHNMSSQSHLSDQSTYLKFKFWLLLIQNVLVPSSSVSASLNMNCCKVNSQSECDRDKDDITISSANATDNSYCEGVFDSMVNLIQRSNDKSLRREVITHVVTPVLNIVFSDHVRINLRLTNPQLVMKTNTDDDDDDDSMNERILDIDTMVSLSSYENTSSPLPSHTYDTTVSNTNACVNSCAFSRSQVLLIKHLLSLILQLAADKCDTNTLDDNSNKLRVADQDIDIGSSILIICLIFSIPAIITQQLDQDSVSLQREATIPPLDTVPLTLPLPNKKGQKSKSKQKQQIDNSMSTHTIKHSVNNNIVTELVECSILQLLFKSLSHENEQEQQLLCLKFWSIIQNGLQHPTDVLLRKRCIYILQFMVKCWTNSAKNSHSSNIDDNDNDGTDWLVSWNLLIDIFSHVEGSNSAHLVSQLMPALDKLFYIVAAATSADDTDECSPTLSSLVFNVQLGLWFPKISFDWIKSLLHCMLHLNVPVIRRLALYRLFSGRLAIRVNETFIAWFCEQLLCDFIDSASYFSAFFLDASYDLGCQSAVHEINYSYSHRSTCTAATNNATAIVIGGPTILTTLSDNDNDSDIKQNNYTYSNIHRKLQREPLNPETYPGVLLPYFLTTLVTTCAALNTTASIKLSVSLTRSLLRVVCREDGIQSLSAMKWIFRPFLEDCVLRLLPKCLTLDDYILVKQFVRGRLHSSNSFVRNQILAGFIPFLLQCTTATTITTTGQYNNKESLYNNINVDSKNNDNTLLLILTLLDLLVHDFTLSKSLLLVEQQQQQQQSVSSQYNHNRHRNLILFQSLVNQMSSICLSPLKEWYGNNDNNDDDKIMNIQHMKLLAILICVSTHHQSQGSLSTLHQLVLTDTVSLYSSVYKSITQVRSCLSYLYGLVYSIKCSVIYQTELKATATVSNTNNNNNNNHRHYHLKLECLPLSITQQNAEYLTTHMTDIASYLVTILRSVLHTSGENTTTASVNGNTTTTTAVIINNMSLLEMIIETLSGLLLLVKITAIDTVTNKTNNNNNNNNLITAAEESLLHALTSVCTLLSDEIIVTAARTVTVHMSVLLRVSAVFTHDLTQFYKPAFGISVNNNNTSKNNSDDNNNDMLFMIALKKLYIVLLQTSQHQIPMYIFKQHITDIHHNHHHHHLALSLSTDMIVNICREQFSRFCDYNLTNRWSAVSSLLCLLPTVSSTATSSSSLLSSSSYVNQSNSNDTNINSNINNYSDDEVDLLDINYLLEQLDICSPSSVVSLLICCKHALNNYITMKLHQTYNATTTNATTTTTAAAAAITELEEKVEYILCTCWRLSMTASDQVDTQVVTAFIELLFSDETTINNNHQQRSNLLSWPGGIQFVKIYFDKLLALAQTCRPYIMINIAYHLSAALCHKPSHLLLSSDVQEMIIALLLYKEPLMDDNNLSNECYTTTTATTTATNHNIDNKNSIVDIDTILNDLCVEVNVSRLIVLTALQHIIHTTHTNTQTQSHRLVVEEGIFHLMRKLLTMNLQNKYSTTAMIGSELFGEKLRCFQALCVLSSSFNHHHHNNSHNSHNNNNNHQRIHIFIEELIPVYFKILNDNVVLSIRVFIEVFGAALGRAHPVLFLNYMKTELQQYNHSQQKIASLFVILGHLFIDHHHHHHHHPTNNKVDDIDEYNYMNDIELLRCFCYLLLSWMSCSQGLPRGIAMLVYHTLYTRLLLQHVHDTVTAVTTHTTATAYSPDPALDNVYQYLSQNKDCVKSLQRQHDFFTEFSLHTRCSVTGLVKLLRTSQNSNTTSDCSGTYSSNSKDICPDHLLTILENYLKSTLYLDTTTSTIALTHTATTTTTNNNNNDDDESSVLYSTLQTKRVPFSEIQLTLSETITLRKLNTAGHVKQTLVVCATLVEKVVNIAGIARTCEIFAVEELVIANKIITKTEAFQGIAVNSGDWLNISQVAESELLQWLRHMKSRNYVIVALEQSDASQSLANDNNNNNLPVKCVLLLGKEKEGVPVHLLNEVDICVEIPQFGVTRSLNVHVSAALFIWEFTRRHLLVDRGTAHAHSREES